MKINCTSEDKKVAYSQEKDMGRKQTCAMCKWQSCFLRENVHLQILRSSSAQFLQLLPLSLSSSTRASATPSPGRSHSDCFKT